MFKKLSISFLFLAILSVMAHTFFPHHEHGNKICFETVHEHCDDDHNKAHDALSCAIGNQEVIRNQDENENPFGCGHGMMCDYHFPPVLLFLGNFFDLGDEPEQITDKPYLNLYTSADIPSANSLRGPPQA